MAIQYNRLKKKLTIEIDLDSAYGIEYEIIARKQALLELLMIAEEDGLDSGTRYWALQMVKDLEPTEEQYKLMFNNTPVKSIKSIDIDRSNTEHELVIKNQFNEKVTN